MNKHAISNRLYWKLSLTFLIILIMVGFAYVSTTAYFSRKYFEESTQLLNAERICGKHKRAWHRPRDDRSMRVRLVCKSPQNPKACETDDER